MKGKFGSIFIGAVLVMSLASSLCIHAGPTGIVELSPGAGHQATSATAVFASTYQTPRYPVGHEWNTTDGQQTYTEGWGGDILTVWADVDLGPTTNLYVKYDYCNHMACYDGEPGGQDDFDFRNASYVLGWSMNHVGGTLWNYQLIGDWMLGYPTYPASNYSGIHVGWTVYAKNATDGTVVVGEQYYDNYPYWPASQINVTSTVSKATAWPGENLWANGSAHYYHRLNWHDNPPADEANVTVNVNPAYQGKTNATGNFSVMFPAPGTPGQYTVNTTVWNDTKNHAGDQNRDATSVCADSAIEVLDIDDVTIILDLQLIYPGDTVTVSGEVDYTDGNPAASVDVDTTIVETAATWPTTTDVLGAYNHQITAPATPAAYTLDVTATDTVNGVQGSNQTPLVVSTPTLDVQFTPSATTSLPSGSLTVTGNATYGNGAVAATSEVNITFDGQPGYWNGTTNDQGKFNISLWSPDGVGTFTLNVSVTGSKYAVTNYNTTQILNTPYPLPDLTIALADYVVESADGLFLEGTEVNHTIWFNATVRNLGNSNATNVVVNFTTASIGVIGSAVVNVTAGSSALASVSWTAIEGNFTVTAAADPQDLIEEAFENNNNASRTIAIDGDLDDDGIGDSVDPDRDGDGYNNTDDAFPDDPGEWNDTDSDGFGDNSDPDIDGDGVPNADDAFPYDAAEWSDIDRDGIGDNADPDIDGDGYANEVDMFPTDPEEWSDYDGDGIGDNEDDDDDNDGIPDDVDDYLHDTDNDGVTNDMDLDDDADGIPDIDDDYPLDTDNDGLHNGVDTDDDGDGVADADDAFPLDPDESVDTDGDGVGNNADLDDDGDGIPDTEDKDPLDPNVGKGGINIVYIVVPVVVIIILGVVIFFWKFK